MFTYRRFGFATVASTRLRGEPGIGTRVLVLELTVTMQPASATRPDASHASPIIAAMHGELRIGKALLAPLGLAFLWLPCVDYAQDNKVTLRALLSREQVRAVELLRSADGGFTIEAALVAQTEGYDGLLPTTHSPPVYLTVTGSDWTRLLKEMQFEDRATFEVPIEGGRVGPPLDKAAAFMRDGLDRLQLRQWDDALTKCREVLTELQQFLPSQPPPWADWQDQAKRNAWGFPDRIAAAHSAVRHATHAGPHASIGIASEHEVRLIVTMTAALLRYFASR